MIPYHHELVLDWQTRDPFISPIFAHILTILPIINKIYERKWHKRKVWNKILLQNKIKPTYNNVALERKNYLFLFHYLLHITNKINFWESALNLKQKSI